MDFDSLSSLSDCEIERDSLSRESWLSEVDADFDSLSCLSDVDLDSLSSLSDCEIERDSLSRES
ncbi:two-component sensor histidine kinase [Pediococcus acidilactici]|nr:two-component sensor histidine kinase [Pediococcus acidilactici]